MSLDNMQSTSCLKKCVLFDLDDTLINTKRRHYHIYCDFLKRSNLTPISYRKYLQKRREGLTNKEVIALSAKNLTSSFGTFWNQSIESPKYLVYDNIIVNTELLNTLKSETQARFVLLSLRSNEETAEDQFTSFPFADLFEDIIFLKHSSSQNPKIKVINQLKEKFQVLFFTGDTESDFQAALTNDITFYGLKTGWVVLENIVPYFSINHLIKEYLHEFRKRQA